MVRLCFGRAVIQFYVDRLRHVGERMARYLLLTGELIAAAHAGCFSMKLSFLLGDAGFTPEKIETTSTVTIEGGVITGSHLVVNVKAPGISREKLQECAENAKVNCPVSKALAAIAITMELAPAEKEMA